MKTSELLKKVKGCGCYLLRNGKSHDIWYSPVTKRQFSVPRHKTEVATKTANNILKDAGVK